MRQGPVVQLVRTPACHAGGRRFEPVLGRQTSRSLKTGSDLYAAIAQSVERVLGKDEVPGSNPGSSSSRNSLTAFDVVRLFVFMINTVLPCSLQLSIIEV